MNGRNLEVTQDSMCKQYLVQPAPHGPPEACVCVCVCVRACVCCVVQCLWRGGTNYRGQAARKEARLCCICFCLSLYYHHLSTVQINPFVLSPIHSAVSDLVWRFFDGLPLLPGPKFFFTEARTRCRVPCGVERNSDLESCAASGKPRFKIRRRIWQIR